MNESLLTKLARLERTVNEIKKVKQPEQIDYSKDIKLVSSEVSKIANSVKSLSESDIENIIKNVITKDFLINLSRNRT